MSVLRPLRQLAASSSRAFASRSAQRSIAFTTAVRPHIQSAQLAARHFSASAQARGEGASDLALTQKLQEEIKYEKEAAAATGVPEFVKEFEAQGVWSVVDAPGNDEIALSRTFGNESIRLLFSIADIDSQPEPEMDEEGNEENDVLGGVYPIRCAISITKTNAPGSISLDAMCQEGAFVVENISFYPDASLSTDHTAEADWKRRGLYIGPAFEQLDPGVQEEFEKFLNERGINESLALFIPDYAEYKEQKEYVKWLESMKTFVEA